MHLAFHPKRQRKTPLFCQRVGMPFLSRELEKQLLPDFKKTIRKRAKCQQQKERTGASGPKIDIYTLGILEEVQS